MLDAIGIGLIFPILPRLLESVTHARDISLYVGVMYALYAAMQFTFSPVLGVISDRFGRRPVLLLSLAGASVDYLLMAFAPALWMLVIGRAIAGLTSANMAIATAYITDITPEEQRARRFGLFHAMFGIGFIIGPVLGGFLGDIWVRAPFIAAAVLNGLNFALALFVLPESRPGQRGAARGSAGVAIAESVPAARLGRESPGPSVVDRGVLRLQFRRPDVRHGVGAVGTGRVSLERRHGRSVARRVRAVPRGGAGVPAGADYQAAW